MTVNRAAVSARWDERTDHLFGAGVTVPAADTSAQIGGTARGWHQGINHDL
jgi:hypothetical protein